MLPKTRAYAQSFHEQTKCIHFLIEDDDVLEKVIRHINDHLSDFSSSDESDDSDEENIKYMKLIILRKQFRKCIF